jgi:hypothetical protein
MNRPSHRTKLIRATVLSVIGHMREPATTSAVIDATVARIDSGDVRGLNIVDRHEVRTVMEGLGRAALLERHHSGEVTKSRGRRSARGHDRAVRGSVTWSLPGNATAEIW